MNKPEKGPHVGGWGPRPRPVLQAATPARLIGSPLGGTPPVPLVRLSPRGVVTDVVLVFITGETREWWTFLGDQWRDWQN